MVMLDFDYLKIYFIEDVFWSQLLNIYSCLFFLFHFWSFAFFIFEFVGASYSRRGVFPHFLSLQFLAGRLSIKYSIPHALVQYFSNSFSRFVVFFSSFFFLFGKNCQTLAWLTYSLTYSCSSVGRFNFSSNLSKNEIIYYVEKHN